MKGKMKGVNKKIKKTGLAVVLLAALCGCNSVEIDTGGTTDPVGGATGIPLSVSMNFSGATIATKSVYDKVGSEAGQLGAVGVLVAAKNSSGEFVAYTTKDADSYKQYNINIADTDTTWKATNQIYLNNNDGTVYAWAPVTGEGALSATPVIATDKLTATGVNVVAAQTFDVVSQSACSQTDYLYATKSATDAAQQTVNKTDFKANLFMHHALAKVSFKIMKGENDPAPDENDYVKKIELTSKTNRFLTASAGTMKLTDGTLDGTSAVATLTMSAVAGKAAQAVEYAETYDDITAQAYGLVAPLASADKDLSVKVTLGSNDAKTDKDRSYQTKTGNEVTFQWEKGKEYTYTINISDVALEIVSVKIVDFGTGGTTNLPVQ
ncbi:fimbrillin family protein [Parabacteroides sp. GYB001]|uniref:fimbrillin family protein n=1 Tax=Parabacteroides leei TaxID=2939491 RepID=UPI002018252F|nr:fimbrillin family protein [Parabacteroides leei]MCL3850360.1 fimbrillin family protein [Parabacteroides leei]